MAGETIEITIDRHGNMKIDVKGGHGESCTKLTKYLEDGLGKITKRVLKPEYREREPLAQEKIKVGK